MVETQCGGMNDCVCCPLVIVAFVRAYLAHVRISFILNNTDSLSRQVGALK